jgi:hypothetical protein
MYKKYIGRIGPNLIVEFPALINIKKGNKNQKYIINYLLGIHFTVGLFITPDMYPTYKPIIR